MISQIDDDDDDDVNSIGDDDAAPVQSDLTYHSLLEQCKTLCSVVQHSSDAKRNVSMILDDVIERYRKNLPVVVSFADDFSDQVCSLGLGL